MNVSAHAVYQSGCILVSFLLLGVPAVFLASGIGFASNHQHLATTHSPSGQAGTEPKAVEWSADFESGDWMTGWHIRDKGKWGLKNLEIVPERGGKIAKILRAYFPKDSASPAVTRAKGAPVGGAQFHADLGMKPTDALHLRYYVRFAQGFPFVKGGKLPGLFGGNVHSGRHIPDGTNGFSTRFMWRRDGDGEVYAYLPTSQKSGTSLGRGQWRFRSGEWLALEQEVVLNTPGKEDGCIRVWLDGKRVLEEKQLTFRTTEKLKIEGIFFCTFFGGDDPSWATPKDTFIDFAGFAVGREYIGP